ncbi:MAG: UDP-3-O-(3-hydroxymyristoyl)glucosamine N-acyltransferase [Legionellales bacterium]|nr:MAG: UDP-3-O-(3-hydroxymyristoyl)glucosamine N-acyltransferase [Legionellales bacterium]
MKDYTLREIAEFCADVEIKGDPNCTITGIATLAMAVATDISFLIEDFYKDQLLSTRASAVIINVQHAENFPGNAIISSNPRLTLAKLMQLLPGVAKAAAGIDATAIIGANCNIATDVIIGPGCVIGANCIIASGSELKANVTLYNNTEIGSDCIIHSGAVIGSDGFGYARDVNKWHKMPHVGRVVIGSKVEIGANTTIDRGFLSNTSIGDGVIIDNLIQIGHNVTIGEDSAIAGCVAIAGSATIGKRCLIGGGARIAGHLEIVDDVHITGTSTVNSSINIPGQYSSGFPAKPSGLWNKNVARFKFLDSMFRRLKTIEVTVQQLLKEKTQ